MSTCVCGEERCCRCAVAQGAAQLGVELELADLEQRFPGGEVSKNVSLAG